MPTKLLCDGIVLASALRDISSEARDVDGLLFGDIQHQTVNVISDMAADYSKDVHTAVLQHVHVADAPWHDAAGVLDKERLSAVVASRAPMQVLGWFTSRVNTSFRPTLRDISVHTNLEGWLAAMGPSRQTSLIFSIFSGSHSEQGHVITQDFRAFVPAHKQSSSIAGPLTALPTVFRNLGQSTQFEFQAFEPSCNTPTDLPSIESTAAHPLEEYVAAAVTSLEEGAVACSEQMQLVSVEQAELASLQAQIDQQRQILHGLAQ